MQPRPTTLPSMTTTSVSRANCVNKISTYGTKYTSSKMCALSSHLVKRLTRLSGLVPSGIFVATLGSWVLLLPTIPLMSAASVVKCLATVPVGWPGYHCVRASRMARYLRRLSLIACSFWIGRAFQREYTMRQPLTTPLQNHLAKVSGSEMKIYLFLSLFISSFRSQKVSGSEICLLVNHRFL